MKKIIYTSLLFIFTIFSCDMSMDEINTNPEKPNSVPPKYLATRIIHSTLSNSTGKNLANDLWLMKGLANNELAESYMYNSIGSTSISYTLLTNGLKMVELADVDNSISESSKKSYRALNKFMQAWHFYLTTMDLGDVPCTDALKGETEGLRKPKYDTQEQVFATIISLLEEASTLFVQGDVFEGDIVYGGNPKLWEKATNSFMLRVLINLSKKTTVGSYNVQTKFEEYAKKSIFAGYSDDFQLVYSDKANQYYPFNKTHHSYTEVIFLQKFLVDMLKKYNDYRLFYFAQPAKALITAGKQEDSFDAYSGVDGTMQHSEVRKETDDGLHCMLNLRYSEDRACEPIKKLSYAEIQFILAEAALKGWSTPSTAEIHYNNAVKASLEFTSQYTKTEYRHNVDINGTYINDYITTYANYATAANKLELIMEQKYIAGFMQMKWNSWFDYRRTGYPQIPINPATSQKNLKQIYLK